MQCSAVASLPIDIFNERFIEALNERSNNGSSDLAQLLFWIRKHAGLGMVRYTRRIASTSMDKANSSVDCGKVEICSLDHPWSELDYLFCGKCLLHDKPANYRIADA